MIEALERLVPTTAEQGPVDQVSEVLVAAVESPSDSQVKTDLRKLHNNLGESDQSRSVENSQERRWIRASTSVSLRFQV